MLATCNACRAHRHGSEVAIPRVNPGSEPVQPPRLTGVWTVADTHTDMVWHGMAWYGQELNDEGFTAQNFIHNTPKTSLLRKTIDTFTLSSQLRNFGRHAAGRREIIAYAYTHTHLTDAA